MNILNDRTTSSFGLSIGTGLMFESLFSPTEDRYDDKREIPNKINVNDFKFHFFNIHTLIRNIVSSTNDKIMKSTGVVTKEILEVLMEELHIIASMYEGLKCIPILYIPDYSSKIKNWNKDKKITKSMETNVLFHNSLLKAITKLYIDEVPMEVIRELPKIFESKSLLTTHTVIDLNLSKNKYLLESYTGKLKDMSLFGTKYSKFGKNSLEFMPVINKLIVLMGDGIYIKSSDRVIHKDVYQLGIEKKWTPYTGSLKISNDLYTNKDIKSYLNKFGSII
jgi:hypothetical protein